MTTAQVRRPRGGAGADATRLCPDGESHQSLYGKYYYLVTNNRIVRSGLRPRTTVAESLWGILLLRDQ